MKNLGLVLRVTKVQCLRVVGRRVTVIAHNLCEVWQGTAMVEVKVADDDEVNETVHVALLRYVSAAIWNSIFSV